MQKAKASRGEAGDADVHDLSRAKKATRKKTAAKKTAAKTTKESAGRKPAQRLNPLAAPPADRAGNAWVWL